jgi:hypothetical protein
VQRDKVNSLNFDDRSVRVVRRLLAIIYEDKERWYSCFGEGLRDLVYAGMDYTPKVSDAVLSGLADMAVRLGGKKQIGQDRWHFSCILLPDNPLLPLLQRSLVVRAESIPERAHHLST